MKKTRKRLLIVLLALCIAMWLTRCVVFGIWTAEQTQKHFEKFKPSIVSIVTSYDSEAVINEVRKNPFSQSLFFCTKDHHVIIEICIYNGTGTTSLKDDTRKRSLERYRIEYKVESNTGGKAINVDLFTDLVNCVSKKKFSQEEIEEFVSAPPEKYPASRFYWVDDPSEVTWDDPNEKAKAFDLLESSILRYRTIDGWEILSLVGKTKYNP